MFFNFLFEILSRRDKIQEIFIKFSFIINQSHNSITEKKIKFKPEMPPRFTPQNTQKHTLTTMLLIKDTFLKDKTPWNMPIRNANASMLQFSFFLFLAILLVLRKELKNNFTMSKYKWLGKLKRVFQNKVNMTTWNYIQWSIKLLRKFLETVTFKEMHPPRKYK